MPSQSSIVLWGSRAPKARALSRVGRGRSRTTSRYIEDAVPEQRPELATVKELRAPPRTEGGSGGGMRPGARHRCRGKVRINGLVSEDSVSKTVLVVAFIRYGPALNLAAQSAETVCNRRASTSPPTPRRTSCKDVHPIEQLH